jgi:hypothetical protein
VGIHDQVGERQAGGDHLGQHPRGQLQLGPVGGRGAAPLGPPQAKGDRDPEAAVGAAPQQHHDVHAVDLALLGERVGPPGPPQPLGEGLLDHHIIQAQVAGHPERATQPTSRPIRLRVDQGVVRSSRLRASWQRPGSTRVTRVCVGRASSRTRPVTYKAIRTAVVGLPTPTPSWSRIWVTWR